MTYLIDSDWIIDHLAGRSAALVLLQQLALGGLATSVISYAEVYHGIYGGRDPKTGDRAFRKLLSTMNVLGVSRTVARRAATIGSDLRSQGRPLALPDLLIAGTALQYDPILVTRNLRHYQRIPNLKLHNYQQPGTAI